MPSPTKRETKVELDLGELQSLLQETRRVLNAMPEILWFDIRTDKEGPYLAGRTQHDGREFSFRISSAVFRGDKSHGSYPVTFIDLLSMEMTGKAKMSFELPGVLFRQRNKRHRVGVPPYDAQRPPFPANGEYYFQEKSCRNLRHLLKTADAIGLREPIRMRYSQGRVQFYTTDMSRTLITSVDVRAEPALWDISVPPPIIKRLATSPGTVVDHIHGFGAWFSDGKNYFFSQRSKADMHDYAADIPGMARAVHRHGSSFIPTDDWWDALTDPGYYLVILSVGSANVCKIDPDTLNYHSDLVTLDTKMVQLPYRGEPTAFIVNSPFLSRFRTPDARIYVTAWPCGPYSISDGHVEAVLVAPEVNPASLAERLTEAPSTIRDRLRNWTGSYEALVVEGFKGSPSHVQEAQAAPSLQVPKADFDALFLIKTPSGFKHAGGVDRQHLATCMYEFLHPTLIHQEALDTLHAGAYWPELQVYIYDQAYLDTHGVDNLSPWPNWITWERWTDPASEQKTDSAGRPQVEVLENRPRRKIKISAQSLSAPQVVVPDTSVEIPEQNSGSEPIKLEEGITVTTPETAEVASQAPANRSPEEPVSYLLIDSHFVTWRDFYQKGLEQMRHPVTGNYTGIAFGYIRSLRAWIKLFRPARVCAVWDSGSVAQWRKEVIPDYKDRSAKKEEIPPDRWDAMQDQRAWLQANLPKIGVRSLMLNGCEADDLIALLADAHSKQGRVVIITGDYDFNHLVSDRIHVYQSRKNELIQDSSLSEASLLRKVIIGDSSDKIPGVPNVGKKTIDRFCEELVEKGETLTLEAIEKHGADHKNYRIRKLLTQEAKDVIQRNLDLIDLRRGMKRLDKAHMAEALGVSLQPVQMNYQVFAACMQEMAFNSILSDISSWQQDFSILR